MLQVLLQGGGGGRGVSGSSTFVRDVPPLGRNHGELSADDLLRDGQVAKVLVEGRVTTEAEGRVFSEQSDVSTSSQ